MLRAPSWVDQLFVLEVSTEGVMASSFTYDIKLIGIVASMASTVWGSLANFRQKSLQISPRGRRLAEAGQKKKNRETLSWWKFLVFCTCTCHNLPFSYNISPLHLSSPWNMMGMHARVHVSSETRKRDTSFVYMHVSLCWRKWMRFTD